MEIVAWLTHRYIMHGILWYFHKDHHTRDNKGFFEKKRLFLFNICFTRLYFYNVWFRNRNFNFIPFWIGLGITIYGAAYFFVHDLFIHQRIKILKNTKNKYLLVSEEGIKFITKN